MEYRALGLSLVVEVGGGLGCMQVSPSLMVLCISMGHGFLLGGRQTSGVWLRGPQCGLLGGQPSLMKACEPNPGLGLRPRVMAGPNCQILGRLPRGQSRGHTWPPFRGHLHLSCTWCLEGFLASFGPRPYGIPGRADTVPPERPHCCRLVCLGIRPILMSFLINTAFSHTEIWLMSLGLFSVDTTSIHIVACISHSLTFSQ